MAPLKPLTEGHGAYELKKNIDFSMLESALQKARTKETSYSPETRTESNPARGQCAVSALLVNEYLGGEIIRTTACLPDGQQISHYFNVINGQEIDVTRTQFPEGTTIPSCTDEEHTESKTREALLVSESTKHRYEILKQRLELTL